LDKISKTEHGKEIVGILTHLTDTTQNDSWTDKYFSGIKLDLSKTLFIFSYNDPDVIKKLQGNMYAFVTPLETGYISINDEIEIL